MRFGSAAEVTKAEEEGKIAVEKRREAEREAVTSKRNEGGGGTAHCSTLAAESKTAATATPPKEQKKVRARAEGSNEESATVETRVLARDSEAEIDCAA